ncbi:MAG TPA: hypothetical protein VK845_16775 [Gemmatimonadales bacterium]|nr:hypothetical protein [Gemmatimonadales bacterium]
MMGLSNRVVERLQRVGNWPDFSGTRYTLIEQVGRGGMGTVYVARDAELDRDLAVKVTNAPAAHSMLDQRLRTEANEIPAVGRLDQWDAINITAKHIKVIPLVEGQAAVALYYSEGMMQPKGSAGVSNYLTRVTQVFVKEGGKWKVRASHWSAVTGGAGTPQTVLEK